MLRSKFALPLGWALLAWVLTIGAQVALGQPAVRKAPAAPPATIQSSASETIVDSSIPDDAAVDTMLEAYSPKVRSLDQTIGRLKGDLKKEGVGGGSLGNFVTDGMRRQASEKLGHPILLAVTNSGGLRKNIITEGNLYLRDVFELMPFENALVAFDLTGEQVLDLLRVVVSNRDAQSGAGIKYRVDGKKQLELESAKFLVAGAEQAIDPAAIYTVISIDFLLHVTGSDYAVVLKKASKTCPLGLSLRDAIADYIKAETAAGRDIKSSLDGRFVLDEAAAVTVGKPHQ